MRSPQKFGSSSGGRHPVRSAHADVLGDLKVRHQQILRSDPPKLGPLARPILSVGLFAFFLWPRYFFIGINGKGVSGFTLAAFALLLTSIMLVMLRRDIRSWLGRGISRSGMLIFALLLFWCWRFVCDWYGPTRASSILATVMDFLYLGIWTIIGMVMFVDRRSRNKLIIIIFISMVIATFFAIIEVQTGTGVADLLGFSSIMHGDPHMVQEVTTMKIRAATARAQSVFNHPLVFGQTLAAVSPVAVHFLLRRNIFVKFAGIILSICILTSIHLSNTRSPLIVAAGAVGLYFLIILLTGRRLQGIIIIIWFALVSIPMTPFVLGQVATYAEGGTLDERMSGAGRMEQVDKANQALKSNPLSGYGDGNATLLAGIREEGKTSLTLDNYYITRAVDNGFLGLAFFIFLMLATLARGIRVCAASQDAKERGATAALTSIIFGIAIGLTVLSVQDTTAMIYLVIGYLIAASGSGRVIVPVFNELNRAGFAGGSNS